MRCQEHLERSLGMSEMQPLQRAGEGADIAGAALWLASDDSSFVTGQSIQVDGGFTVQVRSGGLGRSAT